jgi:hypothetical protein
MEILIGVVTVGFGVVALLIYAGATDTRNVLERIEIRLKAIEETLDRPYGQGGPGAIELLKDISRGLDSDGYSYAGKAIEKLEAIEGGLNTDEVISGLRAIEFAVGNAHRLRPSRSPPIYAQGVALGHPRGAGPGDSTRVTIHRPAGRRSAGLC